MTAPLIFRFNPVPNNRVPNNRPLPIITFLKNIQPPPPQFYSNLPIINFVISKSLFQNFDSISIKTYVKFL